VLPAVFQNITAKHAHFQGSDGRSIRRAANATMGHQSSGFSSLFPASEPSKTEADPPDLKTDPLAGI
jgi:hypothetical protein